MAFPLVTIFQQIFSELQQGSSHSDDDFAVPAAFKCVNGTPVASNSTQSASPMPLDLPSLITFFFSFSALREWFKILVFGSVLEMLRRLLLYSYTKLYDSFFITVTFDEDDTSYSWMCYWLSLQPTWRNARDIEVSTDSFGLSSTAELIEGEQEDPSTIVLGGRQLAYLPSQDAIHTMWHRGHWMRVRRFSKEAFNGRRENYLELRILARSHSVLNNILIEAKKAYQEAKQNLIRVYVSDSNNCWQHLASRPKRSLGSIILDPGMKDVLIHDAKDFLSSKAWYAARGIPFRRGYLLYGAPGSGKTSIIHSLAGELGLDVYIISLSKSGMDDSALSELISDLPEKCIALMEDIDAAFSQTLNRESNNPTSQNDDDDDDEDEDDKKSSKEANSSSPTSRPASRITLSGLLNALDGVGAQEGRILFATTNKYDSLDPALCRPGRMDIHLEFELASRYQAGELFRCFYMPDSDVKEKRDGEEDSGYSSELEETNEKKGKKETLSGSKTKGSDDGIAARVASVGRHTMRSLPAAELERLAEAFAEVIPERELSMASLQGYLMGYKVRPAEAVKDAGVWVSKEREERRKKKERLRKKERRKDEKVKEGVLVQVSDT